MTRLQRRLSAVERTMRPRPEPGQLGAIEIHRLDAWPACQGAPGYRQDLPAHKRTRLRQAAATLELLCGATMAAQGCRHSQLGWLS